MSEQALDLALGAPVHATDGPIGSIERVIVNPETGRATHVVVREEAVPNTLRLVAEKYIAKTQAGSLHLSITREKEAGLPEYIQTDYYSPTFFLGLARQEQVKLPLAPAGWTVEHPATPEGSVALVGHETVMARDGKAGRVDGVLADRHSGRITHLLLRQGHLWGTREVQIPAGLVAGYADGEVRLSATKAEIGALPDVHAG